MADYEYTLPTERMFPRYTPKKEYSYDETMYYLNQIFKKYNMTDDGIKAIFLHRLYDYVFINGSSEKETFVGTETIQGTTYSRDVAGSVLSGKVRRFFRSLQAHAYQYLVHPAQSGLREEMRAKWGCIRNVDDAFILVDWFDRIIPTSHKAAANSIKRTRLSGSNIAPKQAAEPQVPLVNNDRNDDVHVNLDEY